MPSQAAINELNRIDDAPETHTEQIRLLARQNASLRLQKLQLEAKVRELQAKLTEVQVAK